MGKIDVKKIDVFTINPFSGNPAGVITAADGLSGDDMQRIAEVLNLAECAFVQTGGGSGCDFRVRFFTQSTELELSSHALIAACFSVIEEGRLPLKHGVTSVQFDAMIGAVPLDIYFDSDSEKGKTEGSSEGVPVTCKDGTSGMLRRIMIHQKRDDIRVADIPVATLAGILGVDQHEIRGTGLPLEILTHGLRQLIIPIVHRDTLMNMKPDLIKLNLLNRKFDIQTNDIFTLEPVSDDASVYSRSFSPAIGLWEEVGSGSGCGSIGAYLVRHGVLNPGAIIVEQGTDLDCLARVHVEIDDIQGSNISLRIGGLAVTSIVQNVNFEEGSITLC
jgi:PhzF family phenazine biosynthesis protein